MTCGVVTSLSIYSSLVTAILILISVLYSQSGTSIIDICKNGMDNQENKIKTESMNHIDFMNVDLSSQNQECKCSALEYLVFELFEIIVLTLIGIGMVFF